ncbi:hypothetical protein O7599_12920 [Streptomyces sp. WMMC500]|uniref:hypothetical protein n=1 Tax=Streptomyces sp. WMMC500 TaxID=3015154 RepID=UPI00248D34C0|nr:hypothetical protein [Streptomyces sp. WMMC500]WBB63365.1 hypothetical protein O7599_12920 [Streptomyces sp. WMMC500]
MQEDRHSARKEVGDDGEDARVDLVLGGGVGDALGLAIGAMPSWSQVSVTSAATSDAAQPAARRLPNPVF